MTPATPTGAGHPTPQRPEFELGLCRKYCSRCGMHASVIIRPSTVCVRSLCLCEDEVRFNIKETQMIIIHGDNTKHEGDLR